MAVSYVAAASNSAGTGTGSSYTLTMPSGIDAGDLAIFMVTGNLGSNTISFSGWTQVGSTDFNGTVLFTAVFWKEMDGTEDGTTVGPSGSSCRWSSGVVILRGADTTALDAEATPLQRTATTTNTSIDMVAVTPVEDDCMIVTMAAARGFATGTTVSFSGSPTNYTERVDVSTTSGSVINDGLAMFTRLLSGGGGASEDPSNATSGVATARNTTWTVSVAPEAAPSTEFFAWGVPI